MRQCLWKIMRQRWRRGNKRGAIAFAVMLTEVQFTCYVAKAFPVGMKKIKQLQLLINVQSCLQVLFPFDTTFATPKSSSST